VLTLIKEQVYHIAVLAFARGPVKKWCLRTPNRRMRLKTVKLAHTPAKVEPHRCSDVSMPIAPSAGKEQLHYYIYHTRHI